MAAPAVRGPRTPRSPSQTDPDDTSSVGNFFAADHRCWAKACGLGINAAVAYLVLARGTDRTQQLSRWSVLSIETYTGISRSRAATAIEDLCKADLVVKVRGGTYPCYKILRWSDVVARSIFLNRAESKWLSKPSIQPQGRVPNSPGLRRYLKAGLLGKDGEIRELAPEWAWLPNEFVTGAADEIPPLELLRQTQDAMTLRLAVDLYRAQNLREDGGVSRQIVWQQFDRFEVGRRGQHTVWGFRPGLFTVHWGELTNPHRRNEQDLSKEEKLAGKNPGVDFFDRSDALRQIGFIEWVPHLMESAGDDAEIIHPLGQRGPDSTELEDILTTVAHEAACALLTERQRQWASSEGLILVPVENHKKKVQVIGIARLRYRPKTRLTSAWWADFQSKGYEYALRYVEIAENANRR
jgi:hypothetical protein